MSGVTESVILTERRFRPVSWILSVAVPAIFFWVALFGEPLDGGWMDTTTLRGVAATAGGFFTLAAVIGFIGDVQPNRLILSEQGVECVGVGRRLFLKWSDVDSFSATKQIGSKMIGYRLRTSHGARDFDGFLPANFPQGPVAVERLLTDWRRRFSTPEAG